SVEALLKASIPIQFKDKKSGQNEIVHCHPRVLFRLVESAIYCANGLFKEVCNSVNEMQRSLTEEPLDLPEINLNDLKDHDEKNKEEEQSNDEEKKQNEDNSLTNEEIAITETAILNLLQKIQQLKSNCGSLTQALSAIPRKRTIKESNLRNEIKQVASTNNVGCDCAALMKMIKYAATINTKLKISY
ncbi:hypothetical protein RFI_00736, partial [Reticulomyxa filosa]